MKKRVTAKGQQMARTILNRIEKQPEFRRMLLQDPSTALALAGLAKEWAKLAKGEKDPVSAKRCSGYRTCIRTRCIRTCILTKRPIKETP